MKFSRLVKKLNALFNRKQRHKQRQRKELAAALNKLKEKQHELKDRLKNCDSELERAELEEKISILATQRRKGLHMLRETRRSESDNLE
ncbi:MAG: hypothetical protein LRY66_16715 [Saccharospirillaceae bacterium]|nr:hypothetical protein [Saccharospirillaceae bacterium]MCD8532947.1 hypothetical protein [Saccharospirillaceae bacterium]